jgi:hypothetical protein
MKKNSCIYGFVKVVCAVFLLLAVTACSRGANDSVMFYSEEPQFGRLTNREMVAMAGGESNWAAAPMATPSPGSAPAPQASVPVTDGAGATSWEDIADSGERHVIQRANFELESERFDETVAALRQIAPSVDGYIESEMLTNTGWPRLTLVLRVPAARFEEVLRHVESLASVRTQNQWADDVTDHFHDMAGNLATRRIEEERILALIDQATDIHELLALESRLSSVRHSIESYLSQLNQMAGQIAYSTITVTLTCSAAPPIVASATLGERIGGAFGKSVDGTVRALQGIVVFLAGAVIPLMLMGLVGTLVYMVVRVARKKVSVTD